jgi:hypothetical protein
VVSEIFEVSIYLEVCLEDEKWNAANLEVL